jgi:hypothetical protein
VGSIVGLTITIKGGRAMKFKDLYLNESFRFQGEYDFPYSGIAKGPWIKLSARKYKHPKGETIHRVGSIHAEVIIARKTA